MQGELVAGKYRVEELLGQGGMGAVYAAKHTETGRRFAIKWLRPELAGDAEAEARFLREAMLASAINHPAIVEVYDIGRHGDAPYMVMKLLSGTSLGARLLGERIPLQEALKIMLPVLDGVAAAHARGIVHRDLKPDNIMLHREGSAEQPKILDFGISKLLSPDARTRLTKTGISLGTPLYMSPEQVRGDVEVDLRADVYALGVILYQVLTGRLPFNGNNYPDLVLKIVEGNARSMRELNPELSPELDRIVKRAMAKSREDRYAAVTQLAAELRATRGGASAAPRERAPGADMGLATTALDSRVHPPLRRAWRAALWLGTSLAVAVASVALWLFWPSVTQPRPHERRATSSQAIHVSPTTAAAEPHGVSPVAQPAPSANPQRALPAAPVTTPTPPASVPAPSANALSQAAQSAQRIAPPATPARETSARHAHRHANDREQSEPARESAPGPKRPSEIIDPFEQ